MKSEIVESVVNGVPVTRKKVDWLKGLGHRDWLIDGRSIRGKHLLAVWSGLQWSKAFVDVGPSTAGNLGPYWHVPDADDDCVHRLYPKLLQTKWLWLVRRAIDEAVTRARATCVIDSAAAMRAEAIVEPKITEIVS